MILLLRGINYTYYSLLSWTYIVLVVIIWGYWVQGNYCGIYSLRKDENEILTPWILVCLYSKQWNEMIMLL